MDESLSRTLRQPRSKIFFDGDASFALFENKKRKNDCQCFVETTVVLILIHDEFVLVIVRSDTNLIGRVAFYVHVRDNGGGGGGTYARARARGHHLRIDHFSLSHGY